MKKLFYDAAIAAAVGMGVFTITYIITIYMMKRSNKKQGYPRYLSGHAIELGSR
jgi:hypothetical protein